MLTIAGPGQDDYATCRMRVKDDKRFVIYPVRYSEEIQKIGYSKDFWFGYMGEYDDPYIDYVTDNGSMGRGFASYAEASYTTAVGPKVEKRALMFASLYNDKAYIFECSAEASTYLKWAPDFLSIVKSVDFKKSIQEMKTGHYRDFLDERLIINGARDIDVSVH